VVNFSPTLEKTLAYFFNLIFESKILSSSLYKAPTLLFNAHLETIYPALFRKVKAPNYLRERIETSDNDFLDLDWLAIDSSRLVIISHGLEGNTSRAYVRGMAHACYKAGYDALTWNFRGCSEEINRQLRFYHSGATDDLETVIRHAITKKDYQHISLVGFSLGGNLTLKYLGERGNSVLPSIKSAVTFSVPMDLRTGCLKISTRSNWLYVQRFLSSLKTKVKVKSNVMAGLNTVGIDKINSLLEFDNRYTAPIHGFRDALHYYAECSSINYVQKIKIPTLIVNAKNDPFLSKECYPSEQLKNHPQVKLEIPEQGGHVGFSMFRQNGLYWSELRTLEFLQSHG
jgi:uncharacterized protein